MHFAMVRSTVQVVYNKIQRKSIKCINATKLKLPHGHWSNKNKKKKKKKRRKGDNTNNKLVGTYIMHTVSKTATEPYQSMTCST